VRIRPPARPLRRRGVAATAIVLLVAAPWLVDDYTVTLLSRALAVGLLAVSVAVLAGWARLASLGQVAPYAAGAFTAAQLARAGTDVGMVQLGAAAVAGAGFAALIGLAVVHARDVTFLLVTLLVGVLTATAAGRSNSLTGGTEGLAGIPPLRAVWGASLLSTDRAVYCYILGVSAALVTLTVAVLRSPAGLLLIGCRDSEIRMRAGGHPVGRYLYTAIVAAGAIAGAAGALTITATGYISPADVGFDTAVLVLLAVVIGGTASAIGAMTGAALIVGTRDWLAGPWPGHAGLLLGGLFIAAVYARTIPLQRHRLRLPYREVP
jgi:branched-chain amino acid transport system permease protein